MASVHDLRGCCDLCGLEADSEVAEVVALDCSYTNCVASEDNIYHQACLEKYLKSMKCERNRKIGFFCPRGYGKNTKFSDRCKGKITKSHPVSIRSEGNKKRRQAEFEGLNRTISADNEANRNAIKKHAAKEGLGAKDTKAAKAPVISKPIAIGKTSNIQIKALNIGNTDFTKLAPPKPAAQVEKDKAKEAAERIRAEIAAKNMGAAQPKPKLALAPAKPREKTLDEYLAERSASSLSNASSRVERQSSTSTVSIGAPPPPVQPATNAWARMRAAPSALPSRSSDTLPPPLPLPMPYGTDADGSDSGSSYATHSMWGAATKTSTPRSPLSAHHGMGIQPFGTSGGGGGGGVDGASGSEHPIPLYVFNTAKEEIIPGMLATSEPLTGLTKAQRKNLKRAEKKAAAKTEECAHETESSNASMADGSAPCLAESAGVHLSVSQEADFFSSMDASHLHRGIYEKKSETLRATSSLAPPPESMMPVARQVDDVSSSTATTGGGGGGGIAPSLVDDLGAAFRNDPDGDVAQQCMRSLVQHKLQNQVEHLLSLGFPTDAAVGAVVRTGGKLEAAVSLLVSPEGAEYALAGNGQADPVDISEELAHVQMLRARYSLASGAVESAIIVCDGDLSAAGTMLHEQCVQKTQAPAPSQLQNGGLFGSLGLGGNGDGGWGGSQKQNASSSPVSHQGLAFAPLPQEAKSELSLFSNGSESDTWSLFGIGGLTEAAISAVNGSPRTAFQQQPQSHHTQPQNMLPQSMLHGGNPPLYNGGGLGMNSSPLTGMGMGQLAPGTNGGGLWGSADIGASVRTGGGGGNHTGSPEMGFMSMVGQRSPASIQQQHMGGYAGSMYQGGGGMGSPSMSPSMMGGGMHGGAGSLWTEGPGDTSWSPIGSASGGGGMSGFGYGQQQQQQQYHHPSQAPYAVEGRDLNDLMASLGVCR